MYTLGQGFGSGWGFYGIRIREKRLKILTPGLHFLEMVISLMGEYKLQEFDDADLDIRHEFRESFVLLAYLEG